MPRWSTKFPVYMFLRVFVKIGFTPWFPIHCEKTQLGSHSHTYSGPVTGTHTCKCAVTSCSLLLTQWCVQQHPLNKETKITPTLTYGWLTMELFLFNKDKGLIQRKKQIRKSPILSKGYASASKLQVLEQIKITNQK